MSGLGIQAEDDWYRIYVTSSFQLVSVYLRFTHADGDIDIILYDASGDPLASSWSVTDNETINHIVSTGGTYYQRVHYGNKRNAYNLW